MDVHLSKLTRVGRNRQKTVAADQFALDGFHDGEPAIVVEVILFDVVEVAVCRFRSGLETVGLQDREYQFPYRVSILIGGLANGHGLFRLTVPTTESEPGNHLGNSRQAGLDP